MAKRSVSKGVIKDIIIIGVGVLAIWVGLTFVFGTQNPFYVVASGSMTPELQVYDEKANKVGVAKQVGIDSTQSMVLVLTKNDGTEGSIPWNSIKKIGEVILLGNPETATQPGKCSNCGFGNKEGSKFCEECGTKL